MTKPIPFPSHVSSEEDFDRLASDRHTADLLGLPEAEDIPWERHSPSKGEPGYLAPVDVHAQHHTRYAIVLNIGLDGNPFRDVPQQARVNAYAIVIDRVLRNAALRPLHNTALVMQTVAPEGKEAFDALYLSAAAYKEGTNIVTPLTKMQARVRVALAVSSLSSITDQEAVAYRFSDAGARASGYIDCGLAGPKAEVWGPFKASEFTDVIAAGPTFVKAFPNDGTTVAQKGVA